MSIEKEFVPYEQALALKELGFDEPCLNLYHKDTRQIMYNPIDNVVMIKIDNHNKTNHCSAPLYQQAFRWFREKYKSKFILSEDYYWIVGIGQTKVKSYKEAELECLKKLIEIVKQSQKIYDESPHSKTFRTPASDYNSRGGYRK
jgi:hypothetical protein